MAEKDIMKIFNLGIEDIDLHTKGSKKESVLYKPKADEGKDGVYKALIRFVPNPKNPQKSLIKKYVYWLTDQDGQGSYFDAPSTVGDKDPVQELFFKLNKSESAADKKVAESLKRKEVYYSLIQIIRDPQRPELEGKIKVFKFGQKLKVKIDEEANPQFDEPTQVYELFEGKNFELTITKQNKFNNYDSSKFQGKRSAISINGKQMTNTPEDMKKIVELFTDPSVPILEDFEYKAWDDDIRKAVMQILDMYRSPGAAMEKIVNSSPSGFEMESDPLGGFLDEKPSAPTKEPKAPPAGGKQPPVASEEDDLRSFLDGLDV